MKLNTTNERLKHRYFIYLREARQLGEHSIDHESAGDACRGFFPPLANRSHLLGIEQPAILQVVEESSCGGRGHQTAPWHLSAVAFVARIRMQPECRSFDFSSSAAPLARLGRDIPYSQRR